MTAEPRESDLQLARAGLIVTATGIVSAGSVSYALGGASDLAFAFTFILYLGLIAFASARRPFRRSYLVAFGAFALAYIGLDDLTNGLAPGIALYVTAAALAMLTTPPKFRPLTVGAFALWTPALRYFSANPFAGEFPVALAIATVLALFSLVMILLSRAELDADERLRRIGLGLLAVACVATVSERHSVVDSGGAPAPDDVAALVVVALFPILAVARLRAKTRDALATGLALGLYALVGLALILGKGYHVDSVAVAHRSAELFLAGEDPYAALDVADALREFHLDPELGTHLEDGSQVHTLNYPAMSFLVIAPFVKAGLTDIRYVYLGEIILLVLVLLRPIRIPWRPLVAAVVVGNTVIERQNVLAGVDPAWALFTAFGFMFIRHRWLSPIFIGLAVASRQPAWFFAPFYLLGVWRQDGRREALRRAALVAAAALLPNLPFILAAPGAFWDGVTAPTLAPLEPYGVGLIRFATAGVIPLWPRAVYGVVALVVMAGLLVLLWRRWRSLPNAAVVFPSLVLWFAWRSLQNYFGFAGLLALVGDESLLGEEDGPT